MGIHRRKIKKGQHHGPWYVKYPTGIASMTGKIKYTSHKVRFSKRLAELAFSKRMVEWQERKHLGL